MAVPSIPHKTPVALAVWRPARVPEPLISVIIPLASGEAEPHGLLSAMPDDVEIILARGGTRATSMNHAAEIARGAHFWFVHADTRIKPEAIQALLGKLPREKATLYFDLRFDGGLFMRLTELGVLTRSRLLGLPFGDQALCLSRNAFRALGGYDERAIEGEDHLLVRKAHRAGLAVEPVGVTILTSARKYHRNGWFRTTWLHLRLTVRQTVLPLR